MRELWLPLLLLISFQAPAVVDTLLAHVGVFSEGKDFVSATFKTKPVISSLLCKDPECWSSGV